MTQVLQRTVLFADLRGSTSMYEKLGNADATAVVVVAAPGDAVEISARLRSEPSGAVARTWSAVPVDDGTAVVELRSRADGPAVAVRIVRELGADVATPEEARAIIGLTS